MTLIKFVKRKEAQSLYAHPIWRLQRRNCVSTSDEVQVLSTRRGMRRREEMLNIVQDRSNCAFTGDTGWQIIPSNTLKTIDIWKLLRWVVCRYQYWCMVTYRAPRLFTDQCFRFRKTCINYDCRRANAARRVGQWRFQALMQWSQICLSSQKWTPSEWQSCTNNFATLLQNSLRENAFNCSTFTKLSNPASMPE